MKITKIRFYDIDNENKSKFLAKCSIVLDDSIMLHEIKLLNGKKGRYIIMPEKGSNHRTNTNENNVSEDVFHPVDSKFFKYMKIMILSSFKEYEETGEVVYDFIK